VNDLSQSEGGSPLKKANIVVQMQLFWANDEPVIPNKNWCIPFEELSLPLLLKALAEKRFALVHGHSRSGKTSHRIEVTRIMRETGISVLQYMVLISHYTRLQFMPSLVCVEPKDFWKVLSQSSYGMEASFETSSEFITVIKNSPSPVAILIDEFQCILDLAPITRLSFLDSLKHLRDNPEMGFQGCLAFGTYRDCPRSGRGFPCSSPPSLLPALSKWPPFRVNR
jgi:hypothetical protein